MNPLELRKALIPLLGEEAARALAAIATEHKVGAGFNVTVPSWMLVRMAELLAEKP